VQPADHRCQWYVAASRMAGFPNTGCARANWR
jgi:hypothetical protein